MTATQSVPTLPDDRDLEKADGRFRVRLAVPDLLFITLAAVAFGFILYIGRFLTFFWDEFSIIYWRQDWAFSTLMQPFNEHWVLVPLVIYKALLAVVGLRSYVPYLAILLLLHVLTVAAVYRFARRDANGLLALALAACLLFFGTGYEYLLWGAGIPQSMAVATGVWATVLALEGPPIRHLRLVATLLLVSIMSSGMGLFFLVATSVALMLPKQSRRDVWAVAPAIATYGLWYVTLGRNAVSGSAFTLESAARVPEFLRSGISSTVGSLFGLGAHVGDVLAPLLAVLIVAVFVVRRRIDRALVVGVSGLAAQYVLTGLVREPADAGLPRYQYVAAVFILIILASLAKQLDLSFRRPVAVAALTGVVVLSLLSNVSSLFVHRDWLLARADATRALFAVTLKYGGSPALPYGQVPGGSNRPRGLLVVGSPEKVQQVVAAYGSLVTDTLSGTFPISDAASDGVLFQIVKDSLVVAQAPAMPSPVDPISLTSSVDVTVTASGGCLSLFPTGVDSQVVLPVVGGRALYVSSQDSGDAEVFISQHGVFAETFRMNYDVMPGSKPFTPAAGEVTSVTMPDLGQSAPPWLVRFDPPPTGATMLCLGPAGPINSPPA